MSTVYVDASVLILLYLLPAISHILPLPLYLFDPMRVLLFVGYSLSKNNWNAYFLAISIPFFSFFLTGHPVFYKSIIISAELLLNIILFDYFIEKTKKYIAGCLLISMITSKIFYYILKLILLNFGLLSGGLFSTSIPSQLLTIVSITAIFAFILTKNQKLISSPISILGRFIKNKTKCKIWNQKAKEI